MPNFPGVVELISPPEFPPGAGSSTTEGKGRWLVGIFVVFVPAPVPLDALLLGLPKVPLGSSLARPCSKTTSRFSKSVSSDCCSFSSSFSSFSPRGHSLDSSPCWPPLSRSDCAAELGMTADKSSDWPNWSSCEIEMRTRRLSSGFFWPFRLSPLASLCSSSLPPSLANSSPSLGSSKALWPALGRGATVVASPMELLKVVVFGAGGGDGGGGGGFCGEDEEEEGVWNGEAEWRLDEFELLGGLWLVWRNAVIRLGSDERKGARHCSPAGALFLAVRSEWASRVAWASLWSADFSFESFAPSKLSKLTGGWSS